MTDTQLYLAIGVPILVNVTALGVIATLLMHQINAMTASLRAEMGARFDAVNQRMTGLEADIHTITGKVIEIDNRLTRLEERLAR
jgi:SMC interacting uncharacterized protein involved in chromosome segregation